MKFYKTECNKLIQFNPETGVYKQRNLTSKTVVFSKEVFESMKSKQIKRDEFSRLMNIYFKDVNHSWTFEGKSYRKLDNFEDSGYRIISNYNGGSDIPRHKTGSMAYDDMILVYHWGKVYYFTISYNGYKQGQLVDTKTLSHVRWAQAKHCAPIFDETRKKIC